MKTVFKHCSIFAIKYFKWTGKHYCCYVSYCHPLFPDHWPSCSFAQHLPVAIAHARARTHTLCLSCIYLLTFLILCFLLVHLDLVMNIFGMMKLDVRFEGVFI